MQIDPAQPLTTAGEELEYLDHDLPEVWKNWSLGPNNLQLPPATYDMMSTTTQR